MSDLISLYNYYKEMEEEYRDKMAEAYRGKIADVEENRVKSRQFCILSDYVLRAIESEVDES